MSKKISGAFLRISKAFLRISIIILAIAVIAGTLFVLTRKRYVFDFEGRVKLLEQVSQIQKKYPDATVLVPEVSAKLPKSVPTELSYPGAKVASVEQLKSQGISYVLISSDSKGVINKSMSTSIQNAGWELISKSGDSIEAKKGVQKTKIIFETEDEHIVITVAYTYDL